MTKRQSAQRHVLHRLLLSSVDPNQLAGDRELNRGIREIKPFWRQEIKRVRRSVKEPFAGGIEFLKDVLDVAMLFVHAGPAVVLPAAVHQHIAVLVLACNGKVNSAPSTRMQGMQITASGIAPARRTLATDSICPEATEGPNLRIEVRIASHPLPLTIHEEFVDRQLPLTSELFAPKRMGINLHSKIGLPDAIAKRLPLQIELAVACEDDLLTGSRAERDSFIFVRELQPAFEAIRATMNDNRRPASCPSEQLSNLQRRHRLRCTPIVLVVPLRRDMNITSSLHNIRRRLRRRFLRSYDAECGDA